MAMFSNGTGSPFPVGTNPVSNATADLDGDGDLDLLTANYIADNVSVLLNNGSGVFVAGAPVAAGNGPREVEAGDLDGDGDIDFIASNYSGNSVSVRLNNGNGTFAGVTNVAVGTVPRGVALGDLDGDGDLDFVSANYQSNTVSVMLNNGSGVFAQAVGSPIAVGTRPVAVALADLDGDGDRDIAVTSNNTNTVSILLNNGSAGFTAAAPAATGLGPRGISAGDFDGDGDTDLVVTNFGANTLGILLNNGSGVFTAGTPLATGNNPYAVTVGDLDGDGDLDIASTNSGSSSVSVFVNIGAGAFTLADGAPFAVGVSPGGIVMGDFNGDGQLDLSTANFGSNSASILTNNDEAPTGVTLNNVRAPIPENISTRKGIKVADIAVTDDGGVNTLSLAGEDAALFKLVGSKLKLKPGVDLDYATNPTLTVQVNVDGVGVGAAIDAFTTLTLEVIEVMTGTSGADRLIASGRNGEIINALGGNDIIDGRRGADSIVGGRGADTITGGRGPDDFVFKSIEDSAPNESGFFFLGGTFVAAAGQGLRDVITDFAQGPDVLDFSAIDANTRLAGDQSFRWGGAGNFGGRPGKLIVRTFDEAGTANDKTIIYGDNDGDASADFQVELRGLVPLTAADFVL